MQASSISSLENSACVEICSVVHHMLLLMLLKHALENIISGSTCVFFQVQSLYETVISTFKKVEKLFIDYIIMTGELKMTIDRILDDNIHLSYL